LPPRCLPELWAGGDWVASVVNLDSPWVRRGAWLWIAHRCWCGGRAAPGPGSAVPSGVSVSMKEAA